METSLTLDADLLSIINNHFADYNIDQIELSDNFSLNFYLHGESWDGKIDYRVGDFLIALQKDIFYIYNEITESNISFKSKDEIVKLLTITVDVEKKCTYIKALLSTLKNAFPHMSGRQITTVLIVFLLIGGYLYREHINSNERVQKEQIQKQADVEIKRIEAQMNADKLDVALVSEVGDIVTKAIEISTKANKHKTVLEKHMVESDSVEFNGVEYSKKQFKNTYTPVEPEKQLTLKTFKIDENYEIEGITFGGKTMSLMIDGRARTASTRLLDDDSKMFLHSRYEEADLQDQRPTADLLINVATENGEINEIAVIGVGKKRNNSISFKEMLKKLHPDPTSCAQQLTLPN